MVRALGRFLKGRDHGGLSVGPSSRLLADAASTLPTSVRRRIFPGMGLSQGLPLDKVRSVDAEETAQWVVSQYGRGPYPVVAVGSASGAALHLAAALRAPNLPQTILVAVQDLDTNPEDPVGAMHAVAPIANMVARRNPEISVYHMHDANTGPADARGDGLSAPEAAQYRSHRTYERFLEENLAPGGTILSLPPLGPGGCGRQQSVATSSSDASVESPRSSTTTVANGSLTTWPGKARRGTAGRRPHPTR
jgi:hypothetical protein